MHERVRAALDGLYECDEGPSVALAAAVSSPAGKPPDSSRDSRHDDDPGDADSPLGHEPPQSVLAAEIVVGTDDQALQADLPVKHATSPRRPVPHQLVVDELHSYDAI